MKAVTHEATPEQSVDSATFDQTPEIPYYDSFADRKRLSGPDLRAFFRIMEKWEISPRDTRLLLGGISSRYYNQIKIRQKGRVLSPDRLLRVTCLIRLHKALLVLYPRRQAERWALMPNWNLPFRGATPLVYLLRWDILFLADLLQMLEKQAARKSGHREKTETR